MSSHAQHEPGPGEPIAAVYSHVASSSIAEWSVRHTEVYAAIVVFLMTLAMPYPTLAVALAVIVAGGMLVTGIVWSLREAHGTCEQTIRDVVAREADDA